MAGIPYVVALGVGILGIASAGSHPVMQIGSWLLIVLCVGGLASILWALFLPRVAHADGRLLLFLRGPTPIRIPIDAVECFFLGQGPSGIGGGLSGEGAESRNIVVRLAERATEWHHGDLDRRLGQWCDGYITITGTWCEPIDADVVGAMNHDLADLKRKQKSAVGPSVT